MKIQPRGGMEYDWQHLSLVYQQRMRKLKKLICAEGYSIRSDENGIPIELIREPAVAATERNSGG